MKTFSLLTIILMFLIAPAAFAQKENILPNVMRPEFSLSPSRMANSPQQKLRLDKVDNSGFNGIFKGKVTVHYTNKMVTTDATITITNDPKKLPNSHYDFYVIPANGTYLESEWDIDQNKVIRTTTISGTTLYITDNINYGDSGGNSQIRTLVFSPDMSALTFLKTEFDDARQNPATGQIIGRFNRID